jgi:hypothetical protein
MPQGIANRKNAYVEAMKMVNRPHERERTKLGWLTMRAFVKAFGLLLATVNFQQIHSRRKTHD